MELPINLDLLAGNQKFGLDMCIKSNDEYAKRLVASLRGTVVKMIDPAELPVAVISDRRYAQHLQVSSHDDQMKLFKVLPLMLKDAVLHKIPIVSLEQFAAEVQKRLHSGTPRGSSRKRPLEEPIPNPYHTDNEPPSTLVRIEDHHVLIRDSDPQYATILKAIDPSEIVFHLGTDFGSSLFDKATPEMKLKRTDELVADESHDIEYVDPTFKEHGKPEMVRAMVGYCDYCKLSYADIFMHCKTAEHQAKVDEPDGKFDALDEILYKYNDFLSDPVPKDLTNNNATPAKDVKDEHTKDATEKPRAGDLPRSKTRDSVLLQTSEMSEPGIRTANEKVVSDGCPMRQNEGLKEQN